MAQIVKPGMVRRLAGLELNILNQSGALPPSFEGARIGAGTPIYDLNGALLTFRAPVRRDRNTVGHVDVAADDAFGQVLLSVGLGGMWKPRALFQRALDKLDLAPHQATTRFVAYSYPKFGVQVLVDDEEEALLDCQTWKRVPQEWESDPQRFFRRWSYLDALPKEVKLARARRIEKALDYWERHCPASRPPRGLEPDLLNASRFERLLRVQARTRLRYLHFSTDDSHHEVCFEYLLQRLNTYCVPASIQMLLAFYRYEYDQRRIAADLNLGNDPLPYGAEILVANELAALTSNALTAAMNEAPAWQEFVSETRANRPTISFIPEHSRDVAGFVYAGVTLGDDRAPPRRYLYVYDPWYPETGGVPILENFDAQIYRKTFTASVTHV